MQEQSTANFSCLHTDVNALPPEIRNNKKNVLFNNKNKLIF